VSIEKLGEKKVFGRILFFHNLSRIWSKKNAALSNFLQPVVKNAIYVSIETLRGSFAE